MHSKTSSDKPLDRILVSWSVFAVSHTSVTLAVVLAVAVLVTFSPVLLRRS